MRNLGIHTKPSNKYQAVVGQQFLLSGAEVEAVRSTLDRYPTPLNRRAGNGDIPEGLLPQNLPLGMNVLDIGASALEYVGRKAQGTWEVGYKIGRERGEGECVLRGEVDLYPKFQFNFDVFDREGILLVSSFVDLSWFPKDAPRRGGYFVPDVCKSPFIEVCQEYLKSVGKESYLVNALQLHRKGINYAPTSSAPQVFSDLTYLTENLSFAELKELSALEGIARKVRSIEGHSEEGRVARDIAHATLDGLYNQKARQIGQRVAKSRKEATGEVVQAAIET